MSSTLPKTRLCTLCETTLALDSSGLCAACIDDTERDNEVANFEYYPVCAGELNVRGYCYDCLDGWTGAQVRDAS